MGEGSAGEGRQEGLGLGSQHGSGSAGVPRSQVTSHQYSSGGPASAWCVGTGSVWVLSGCAGYPAGRGVCAHVLWGLGDDSEKVWVRGSVIGGALWPGVEMGRLFLSHPGRKSVWHSFPG